MTHIRKRDHFMEHKQLISAECLKVIHTDGTKIAVDKFEGTIAAVVMNLIALIGRNETQKFLNFVMGNLPPPYSKPTLVVDNDGPRAA